MGQQVWAFLSSSGESWAVRDLVRRMEMPESTVRGQLNRLLRAGKVEARYYKGGGCFVFKVVRDRTETAS